MKKFFLGVAIALYALDGIYVLYLVNEYLGYLSPSYSYRPSGAAYLIGALPVFTVLFLTASLFLAISHFVKQLDGIAARLDRLIPSANADGAQAAEGATAGARTAPLEEAAEPPEPEEAEESIIHLIKRD